MSKDRSLNTSLDEEPEVVDDEVDEAAPFSAGGCREVATDRGISYSASSSSTPTNSSVSRPFATVRTWALWLSTRAGSSE